MNKRITGLLVLMLLFCMATSVLGQNVTVTGTVTDATSDPLIGVNVQLKGTTIGVITGIDGKFTLQVPGNQSVLVLSYVGYLSQEITIGAQRTLNVVLREDTQSLDEIVVIGYGTQKRTHLTGAIGTASGEVLENRPISTIGEGLQGVIPNLQIVPQGTAPGQGASFNIRGFTSINGGGPLILVDGIQQDPNLLNPNDIESVTVLKDASSSAIYGARAGFGVILFTTKSGQKNQKPKFNVSSSWSSSSPVNLQHTMSAFDYVNIMNLSARNSGQGAIFGERQVNYIKAYNDDPRNNLPVYYDPLVETDGKFGYCGNSDWADIVYRNGAQQQYNVSMSGGSENTRYFVSYGILDQNGILNIYNDKYQRHTINMDLTTDIKPWLIFGSKIKYTHSNEDHPSGGMSSSGLGATTGAIKGDLPPFMPIYHPDGSYAGQGDITNPMAVGKLGGYERLKVNDLSLTGKLTIQPLEGWNINTDFTFNPYGSNRERVITRFMEKRADGSEYVYPWVRDDGVTLTNNYRYYTSFNIYSDYSKSINSHYFKVTLGYNQEIQQNKSFNAQRLNLIDKDTPHITLATGTQTVGGSATSWAVQGIFGRLHYNFDEKYLIDITGRYDGTSKFAKGDRFVFLPSVGAAWYISKENFMKEISKVITDLKLRGSYGVLGNQNVGSNFAYVPDYSITTNQSYLIGNVRGIAVTAPGLVSPNLTWETVRSWNIAVDFGVLKNKLKGTFDYYNRSTIGMLTSGEPLPGVLGTGVPQENACDLVNKGWELSIDWRDRLRNIGLNYYATFVLSDSQAEYTKAANPTGLISSRYVGMKQGEIWGYQATGLFQSYEEIAAAPSQTRLYNGTWHPGDVRYVDRNGNGEIFQGANTLDDPGDRYIIGNTTARLQYGLTLGADWKGFDIDIFLQGVGKRDWFPDSRFFGVNGRWDVPSRNIDSYWTEENPNGYLPKQYQESRGNRQTNSYYLQDASYLRFKKLTIGYTVPNNLTRKFQLEKIRIYFTGQNLFTFTKLSKMYDPETMGTAASSTGVTSNMTYPVARVISGGLNITF